MSSAHAPQNDSALTSKTALERASVATLHEQISRELRSMIEALGADAKLPSEEEFVRRFNVSRTTVRRALRTLVEEGLLVRRQGKGTFVAERQIVQSLTRLRPLLDSLVGEQGVTATLLDLRWVSGAEIPAAFEDQESALTFRRLYRTEVKPHGLIESTIPEALGRQLRRADLEARPILEVLQELLGVALLRADFTITCGGVEPEIADLLHVEHSNPLLILRRVTYAVGGAPVECATQYLLPEVHRLQLTVDADRLAVLAPPGAVMQEASAPGERTRSAAETQDLE